jgi:hypothetical protein
MPEDSLQIPPEHIFSRIKAALVQSEQIIQGRRLGPADVALIGEWLALHSDWNRTRLSRELCSEWNWRNAAGRLKDMACRTLLLKLEARGQIQLPPRRTVSVNGARNQTIAEVPHDRSPIQCEIEALRPVQLDPLAEGSDSAHLFKFLLQRYHYLGHRNCVGENLKYLARDRAGRPLACLLFGSAAWKTRARDAWIGWGSEQRRAHLFLLTNNTRFLILPWVRAPHLASHLLSQVTARLSTDWQGKYGHPIYLVESFVEPDRFAGACYRAAGWLRVGATTGRSRNDAAFTLMVPIKEVYLKPLSAEGRRRLAA